MMSSHSIVHSPDFTIRAALPSDAHSLTTFINLPSCHSDNLFLPYQTVEQTRVWLDSFNNQGVNLIALQKRDIIGQASLTRNIGRRAHAAMIGIGVHHTCWRQGVGSALMAKLIDMADNWLDLQRLELTVFSDNEAAIALYRKFGFETEGVHRAYAFRAGRYEDALAMARLKNHS